MATRHAPRPTTPLLLRPGLRVLPRAEDEVQVGTDPRWAVRIADLSPSHRRLWLSVDASTDLAGMGPRAQAAGVDEDAVAVVVQDLVRAGLTWRPTPAPDDPAGPADVAAWSLLRPDPRGERVVDARSRAVVGVVGLGPTGLGIARHLALAGVGTLLLDDDAPVAATDVAAGSYAWPDVGTPRQAAAHRLLRDLAPRLRVEPGSAPDVVVVVEHDAADPVRALRLVAAGVPHLSVVVRTADAVVGPLVRPGTDPCLRCLDLHRADADPAWPTVLGALTHARSRTDRPSAEVAVLAAACAATAAAHVLTLLAGAPSAAYGSTTQVSLPDLVTRHRRWSVHPACGCTVPPRTPDAGPHEE